ncbi:acyltransferase family protein [Escherichia coli]
MRNNSLDVAKYIACFCIIIVHVGSYAELPGHYGSYLRAASRWALPFFFVSYGYTLGLSNNINLSKRLNKLVAILFSASVIYIPLHLYYNNWNYEKVLDKYLNINILHGDGYFHLWFVNSLILGVILTSFFISNFRVMTGVVVAVTMTILCWVFDLSKYLGINSLYFYIFRFLLGFSLVYLAYAMSKAKLFDKIPVPVSVIGFFVSGLLIFAECYILKNETGRPFFDRQVPLFSLLVPFFIISFCTRVNIKDNFVSMLGREYSLCVYLLHPMAIYFIGINFKINSTAMLFISFVTTMAFSVLLKYLTPYIYNRLNGVNIR